MLAIPKISYYYPNLVALDKFSVISIFFISLFLLIFIKITYTELAKQFSLNNIILFLIAVATLIFLVQLKDIFMVYLGIILLSLTLYPLIALNKKSHSNSEAVSKYFFLGSISAGVMLYGISLIYRELHSLSFKDIKQLSIILSDDSRSYALIVGFIFISFGFLFKLSIVPLQN